MCVCAGCRPRGPLLCLRRPHPLTPQGMKQFQTSIDTYTVILRPWQTCQCGRHSPPLLPATRPDAAYTWLQQPLHDSDALMGDSSQAANLAPDFPPDVNAVRRSHFVSFPPYWFPDHSRPFAAFRPAQTTWHGGDDEFLPVPPPGCRHRAPPAFRPCSPQPCRRGEPTLHTKDVHQ
jgi:hypothetical protein